MRDAQRAWVEHVHGAAGRPACPQCRAAPGPPPPHCPPTQRELYACDEGLRLHEAAVLAAQDAYRKANPAAGGIVSPPRVYLVGEDGPEQVRGG